ncbi:glycoside hydrolase family 18 protein [Suillus clintonianus]|uniref:glycoside hydrolase family 18 protein n=1 Tax=Suillus clintonianus TaxID=1904413 RepID=UPI001B865566|nr:glycoside hydrolase family 18 protein [Suillus clintonianus]KAG2135821.1 glycoside hydrolase family 18 protein [Suillus clintonianus]
MLSTFLLPILALSAVSATPLAAPSIATRSTKPVVGAWYAGWRAEDGFPLSYVSWEKYTTLYYSFAEPTQNISTLSLAGSDGEMLPQFVTTAHANDVEAHIAVGGWTGSVWFSSHLSTAANRTAFVQTVADFALQYNLDGVQFDWEYPNHQGIGCNTISVNDTANFLAFLQELRANPVAERLTLSAAVTLTPFNDATGSPSADVSGFAKVLDYVSVMNYDVWGSWSSTVGPNAPLNDTCAAPANQQGSAVSAVKAWTDAGMPANQIVLGVAAYGHSFSVSPSNAFMPDAPETLVGYPAFNASNQPLGDAWDDTGSVDVCGVYEGPGGTYNFWGLIDDGFLTETGAPANGIFYRYDNCSQTTYVYNETSQVMVSFDNIPSFAAKGEYIKDAGLRGFSMWQAGGDHNDLLLDSIIDAFGCN